MKDYLKILMYVFAAVMVVACTRDEQWGTKWDAELGKPEVTIRVNEQDMRIIDLPNGVSIFETRRNGKISSQATDNSGYGAVFCIWEIYVTVHNLIDACYPGQHKRRKAELEEAIDKIDDFIITNSKELITKEQLKAAANNRTPNKTFCGEKRTKGMIRDFVSISSADLAKNVNDMLSVPRLPVFDPCL